MDMLALQERRPSALADAFSASDAPEGRIDIVRAHWTRQMEDTRRRLRALESAPTTAASTVRRPEPVVAEGSR